jgi:hypothetical protein
VILGNRVEVDLAVVTEVLGEQLAEDLYSGYRSCAAFNGRCVPEGLETVRMQRVLTVANQRTSKQNRADLEDELEALERIGGVGVVVDELLGAEPDWEALAVSGSPFYLRVRHDGDFVVTTLAIDAAIDWVPVLGGPASTGEVRRWLEISSNYAAWRDRRVRRLVRLCVTAEERWPCLVPA